MENRSGAHDILASLLRLFGPLCLETFFMMLAGVVDTLMLSSVGDLAVGAVGTANSYVNLVIVMFNIAATGMLAVMTLYIGAGQENTAHRARRIGLAFNALLGAGFSALLFFGATPFLAAMGVSQALLVPTGSYLRIVGGGCLLNALTPIFSGHLRAFGHTRQPFIAAMLGNVLNVALNAVFLYGLHAGVAGVAVATVIARLANLLLLMRWSGQLMGRARPDPAVPSAALIRQIMSIGIPSACENIIYSASVTLMVSLLNRYDPSGFSIAARSYALQITSFSHCASAAFGQANAIMAGWYIGAERENECTLSTRMASILSAVVALLLGTLLALLCPLYMHLFTDDPQMVRIVQVLLYLNILLEVGRAVNVCYGNALKAIGDARFPMMIGAVFMLLAGSGGTWLFTAAAGLLPAVSCFIGMLLDECARAVLMLLRWRSGAWRSKSVIRRS